MPITIQPHRLQVKNNLGQLQYLDAVTDRPIIEKLQEIENLGEGKKNEINQIVTTASGTVNSKITQANSQIDRKIGEATSTLQNQYSIIDNNIANDLEEFSAEKTSALKDLSDALENAKEQVEDKASLISGNMCSPEQLQKMIAPVFNSDDFYTVGQHVIHPGEYNNDQANLTNKLYRIEANHSSGQTWANTTVQETTLINSINQYIKELQQGLTNINLLAGFALDIDNFNNQINNFITRMSNEMLHKVDCNQIASLAKDIDQNQNRILFLQEQATKRNNRILNLATMLDMVTNKLKQHELVFSSKEQIGKLFTIIDDVQNKFHLYQSHFFNINELASIFIEIDQVTKTTQAQRQDILALYNQNTARINDLNNKVSKPNNDANGVSGQVLSTNGDGSTSWINPINPSNEQIQDSINTWLNNHPEATTTVADNSITLNKLSNEVQNILTNAQVNGQSAILTNALTLAHEQAMYAIKDPIRIYQTYKNALFDYANYFKNDGLGFLFFTDPHTATETVYSLSNYELYNQLDTIKIIFENCPAQYVLCGGDWLNMYHLKYDAMGAIGRINNLLKSRISERCYTVIGNHDSNTQHVPSNQDYISREELSNLLFGQDVGYYTIEGNNHTVFMFDSGPVAITSSYSAENDYDLTQLIWLGNKLLNNTKEHLIGVIHIINRENTEDGWVGNKITEMLNAFNTKSTYTINNQTFNFSNRIGKFHFMMAGHFHDDHNLIKNGIPVIYTTRPTSTVLLDCCYANFTESKLYLKRIGDTGTSRIIDII